MNLLTSLLDAIVRLEGDALVMHVGEKPYVVTTTSSVSVNRRPLAWGQVELSSRVLTPDAVLGMLTQILPPEERQALEHLGAIEYHVPAQEGALERFRIIAARGGDDIWLELRRHRPEPDAPAAEPQPEVVEPAAAAPLAVDAATPQTLSAQPAGDTAPIEIPAETASAPAAPFEIVHEVNQAALTDEDVDALIEESARALPTARAAAPSDGAVHAIDHTPPPTSAEIPYVVEPEAIELSDIELTLDETEPEPVEIAAAESQSIVETSVAAPEPVPPAAEAPSLPERTPVVEAAVPVADHAISIAVPELTPAEAESPRPAMNVVAQESIPDVLAPAAADVSSVTMAQPPVAAPEPIAPAAEAPITRPVEPETPVPRAPAASHVPEPPAVVRVPPPAAEPPRVAPDAEREAPAAAASLHEPAASMGPRPVERPADARETPASREPLFARDETPELRPVVVPLSRRPQRDHAPASESFGIEDLLRSAAARGASTMYLVAHSDPMLRTEGEFSALHIGSPLGESDIERMLLEVAPEAARDAWQRGAPAEWICDIPGIGRVRAITFTDHRGHGLIFRMTPPLAISADQLGLPPVAQAFCSESDGLVIVAGPRASGKSTLLAAFVDLINRTRSDHVITLERQIGFVHENRRSFISQREVAVDAGAAAARAALREDPDVLVIEDVRSEEEASTVLEAADSGRLVFASMTAGSTVDAVERFLELFTGDRRTRAQEVLATVLRGMLAQVLLRRARGGRIAAREVLLKTSTVGGLIERGQTAQLARVIESGRRHGMIPLNDALAAVVRDGTVQMTEAYRKTFDKDALLAALKRDGIDTSVVERLA